jgi:hypothetical protein
MVGRVKERLMMNDSSMIKIIIIKCVSSAIFFYAAIKYFKGRDVFNKNERIKTKSAAMRIWLTRVLPVIIVAVGIWFSGEAILDYTIKDYQTTTGILEDINAPFRLLGVEEFMVEDENDPYHLPKGFLKYEEHGQAYEFSYGKRSRIIIQIREITP